MVDHLELHDAHDDGSTSSFVVLITCSVPELLFSKVNNLGMITRDLGDRSGPHLGFVVLRMVDHLELHDTHDDGSTSSFVVLITCIMCYLWYAILLVLDVHTTI